MRKINHNATFSSDGHNDNLPVIIQNNTGPCLSASHSHMLMSLCCAAVREVQKNNTNWTQA